MTDEELQAITEIIGPDALDALEVVGYAVVPVEPSNAVAFAGAERARELDRDPKCILRAEACADIYRAMIQASKGE